MRIGEKTARGRWAGLGIVLLSGIVLASCMETTPPGYDPANRPSPEQVIKNQRPRGLFGDEGIFGGVPSQGDLGIGVNSYLWRASLDTVSFMPVTSADPFGGVIITDWYSASDSPKERFKLNVYILGKALRADGVRVAVFRQVKDGSNTWESAPVPPKTGSSIEDAILSRARELRYETLLRRQQ